ncbi:MAG: FtsX-like permease family protein [Lutisporaceae bacterium]
MIKNYLSLVPRYLFYNKKRTAAVALCIVFCVTLLTSVGIIINSYMSEVVKVSEGLYGKYHGSVKPVRYDKLDWLETKKEVSKAGTMLKIGNSKIGDYSLSIIGGNKNAWELLNIKVLEGKLPERDNEIAVEKWIYDQMQNKPKLGEALELQYVTDLHGAEKLENSTETADFILCGILEDSYESKTSEIGKACIMLNIAEKLISREQRYYEQYFNIKENLHLSETLDKIGTEIVDNKIGVYYENNLMVSSAEANYKSKRLAVFIDLIVAIAAIMVVFNVFNISITERLRHFGLLRSIGITPNQIKLMLLGEALLLSLIFIPIGILLGIEGVRLILKLVGGQNGLNIIPRVSLFYVSLSAVLGLMSIIIAVYNAAKLGFNLTPIESINIDSKILKENGNISGNENKVIGKFFGYTGKMAFINLIRNKKRFIATTVSIGISIALFISVNYLVSCMDPAYQVSKDIRSDYILTLKTKNENIGYNDEQINNLINMTGVVNVEKVKKVFGSTIVKTQNMTENGLQEAVENAKISYYNKQLLDKGECDFPSILIGCSEEYLKAISKNTWADYAGNEKPYVYVIQNLNYADETSLKAGDDIRIGYAYKIDNQWKRENMEFKIKDVLQESPIPFNTRDGKMAIITNEKLLKDFLNVEYYQNIEIYTSKKADVTAIETQLKNIVSNQKYGKLISYREEMQRVKDSRIVVGLILYSLVLVIILVALINIVNTMSMNIILRKREFGMLRAMGMTKGQLTNTILKEGFFYGLISSIWGVIIGVLLILLIFYSGRKGFNLRLSIDYTSIAFTFVSTLTLCMASTILPLRRATSAEIVEAIRAIE